MIPQETIRLADGIALSRNTGCSNELIVVYEKWSKRFPDNFSFKPDAVSRHRTERALIAGYLKMLGYRQKTFSYCITHDDVVVGECEIRDTAVHRSGAYAMSCFIEPDFEGKNIAFMTCSALLDRVKPEGLLRISAETQAQNVRSRRLLKRLGFAQEPSRNHEWLWYITHL